MTTITKPREDALREITALRRTTMKREAIRVDEDLYPRFSQDDSIKSAYAEAMRAGAEFPPVVVDQHGRLIDGVHRLGAYDINGVKVIPVERVKVKDDLDLFRRAMTANAHHGRRYTSIDYAHIVLKGRKLGLADEEIAPLVYVTPGFLEDVTRDWFALNTKKEQVAIKRTIKHMKGRKLTDDQVAANQRLGGMQPGFYINQIMLLMDNDLIDTENPKIMEKLRELQESLGRFFLGIAKKERNK